MLREGNKRTFKHNLSLAIMLSLTAGAVNVPGFFAFAVLTTNITGHVATLASILVQGDQATARIIELWAFLFFAGSFVSSFLTESIRRIYRKYASVVPIMFEIMILLAIWYYGDQYTGNRFHTKLFVGTLLFAMGMQNAIVSVVSGSIVRTSHLTGMFTDLGINLSRLIFATDTEKPVLHKKIFLHLAIVMGFFMGGLAGGLLYVNVKFHAFLLPVGILLVTLFYDLTRLRYYLFMRKLRTYKTRRKLERELKELKKQKK